MKKTYFSVWVLAVCLALVPATVMAQDFADYKTAAGSTAEVDLPTVEGGWFTAVDYFPEGTVELVDGQFEAEGRMIAANNQSIYLQRTYGSNQWDVVGTISSGTMDPSFIHVSPDGSKIALGIGYGAPLLIIPTSVLSAQSPPVLDTNPAVTSFPNVSYYDGDWADNRYFVINGGAWPGPDCTYPYHDDPDCVFYSGVGSVDTQDSDPANHTGVLVIGNILGASADVDVDSHGNLITGIGYLTNPNRTGQLKVWAASDWDPATPQNLDYDANTRIVADNILSAAYLGEDAEGNLHVGGGDAFGVGGPDENGYAALIQADIVNDVATGSRTAPVTDGNKADIAGEYKYFAPDLCQDDSATGILAGNWGRGLAVMWNPSGDEAGGCAPPTSGGVPYPGDAGDYWLPGVTPRLTIYYPGSAPDTDGDGIPDASDNAYLTANAGQEDTDGDGYGNAADADFNNDNTVNYNDLINLQSSWGSSDGSSGWDANVDLNSDGNVNDNDLISFQSNWGASAPYY